MDIYKFVVSNSIRNYLKRINYKFSTQEAAFLVWYCETATLEEKFGAWEEIINTMPNCSMQERIDMEAIPDFHKFLIDYIKLQKKLLNKFKTAEKVYILAKCIKENILVFIMSIKYLISMMNALLMV